MRNEFSGYHPLVNITFYVMVMGITMIHMNIYMTAISFAAAAVYSGMLRERSGAAYIKAAVVMFFVSALWNPLFSHRGQTLLTYLPTGNPITLESIVFGIEAALIISATIVWFSSFNIVMTEDKIVGLIGKVLPNFALLILMTLRFIPKFAGHGKAVAEANYAVYGKPGRMRDRIKMQLEMISATTTWALENSVDTADAMQAKGYGCGKRTSYDNYYFEKRDFAALGYIIISGGIVVAAIISGESQAEYYPVIKVSGSMTEYTGFALLCLTPVIINILEMLRWLRLRSKI